MSGGIDLQIFGALDAPQLVELVRVAETAERYEDMCKFVKALVQNKTSKGQDLDVEERNLLSVAYKNVVGSKRASWRTLSGGFDDADEALIEKYKGIVENELENICKEVIALLVDNLLKTVSGKKRRNGSLLFENEWRLLSLLGRIQTRERLVQRKIKRILSKSVGRCSRPPS